MFIFLQIKTPMHSLLYAIVDWKLNYVLDCSRQKQGPSLHRRFTLETRLNQMSFKTFSLLF